MTSKPSKPIEWSTFNGSTISRVETDGEDVVFTFEDGGVVRAIGAARTPLVVECLSDPDYGSM